MIFSEPINFDAAIAAVADKRIKPTALSSAEIAARRTEFDERSLFSARTLNAQLLQGYQDQLAQLAKGDINTATARARIKSLIDELGLAAPSEREAGTITDLGSNSRIGLVLTTILSQARGFGQYLEGLAPGALDAFPASELIRVYDRMVPREWFDIWDDAAAELGDETTATSAEETGRMVAAKGDPIWLEISDFGQPWPPFKFNSGMGLEDVDYQDAVDLGVIEPNATVPQPEAVGFNEGVESSTAGLSPELIEVLGASLEGIADKVGGFFRMSPPAAKPIANDARALRQRATRTLALLQEAA